MKLYCSVLLFVFISLSCKKEETPKEDPVVKDVFVTIDYTMTNLPVSTEFAQNSSFGGPIENEFLVEASGLAVSRFNPTIVWSHNDSGHANRIYAVGNKGENYGVFLVQGASSRDWEDMCIGVGPVDGVNYIYVADIGDNSAQYNYIIVYRFPEPEITSPQTDGLNYINSDVVERMEFTYPDGARDAETLMIDPWTKDLYIVSKRNPQSLVYRAKYPQTVGGRTELEKLAQLPFNWAVAGDISPDGKQIAIKDRYNIYYWTRNLGESVVDALKKQPVRLPYIPEPQGESFAWTGDNNGYFTLSEKNGPPIPDLYFYNRVE